MIAALPVSAAIAALPVSAAATALAIPPALAAALALLDSRTPLFGRPPLALIGLGENGGPEKNGDPERAHEGGTDSV